MSLKLAKGKKKLKIIGSVLKHTVSGFADDSVTKLAGSLAYTIVFSLGPLLLIIIALCSVFLGREATEGQIYLQLAGYIGNDAAAMFQEVVANASLTGKNVFAVSTGVVTLLIGATAVFAEIQGSVNIIWGIKPQPKRGWLKFLQNRFLSFSIIISLGFVLLVTLVITGFIDGLSSRLMTAFPEVAVIFFYLFNLAITFFVTSLIFAVIFKVLPDANIQWKHVRAGAFATAILFMIGKFAISFYVNTAKVGNAYGAASSIIVLLTWVYFSSLILYFGAEFTKYYALYYGDTIRPNKYAVGLKTVEIETTKVEAPDTVKKEMASFDKEDAANLRVNRDELL